MQDEQGRDYPPVPATPEVAVHRDGGLRRPARRAGRLRLAAMQAAKTSGIVVLPVFSQAASTNAPRFSGSRNPLDSPTYSPCFRSASAPR